jgi:fumarate hydratase subunit beta
VRDVAEYHLRTPISEKAVRRLRVKDIVFITGEIFTARDAAHRRALAYHAAGRELPITMEGKPLFHCGPLVREADGTYEVVAAGPTTSMRMEMFEDAFIDAFRVPVIIGKGGMGSRTRDALEKFGAVYCAFPGGAGALAAKAVHEVKAVEWLDLGMPEAMWILDVKALGPLTVAMDAHGNSLYAEVGTQIEKNKERIDNMIQVGTTKTIT